MKINSINTANYANNTKANNRNAKKNNNPNFKGLMDFPGTAMNLIEKGGFVASFLVQDTLGMTVPRTLTGTVRGVDEDRIQATKNYYKAKLLFQKPKKEDEEKRLHLKDLNFKEGAEVGIREGLSGPLMMFTPILVLLAGKKFVGKSSYTNSSLIRRLGKNMKEVVSSTQHDSVDSLKKDFYRKNLTKMVKETTGSANAEAENNFVNSAMQSMARIDKLDAMKAKIPFYNIPKKHRVSKLQKQTQSNLVQSFNDFHKENSNNYDLLNNVSLDGATYKTGETIDAIRAYSKDVLNGKKAEDVTEKYVDNVKTKSVVGRMLVNAAAAVSTIGSLSIVPKLYKLVNPVPPGALGDPKTADAKASATAQNNAKAVDDNKDAKNNNGNVSFRGGKLSLADKAAKTFEFDGHNLTKTLMLSLSAVGLLTPRVATAAKRAPEDPVTKKKDYSEIPEIVTRDVTSTVAVTCAVPVISDAIFNASQKKLGFVLTNEKKNFLGLRPSYGSSSIEQIYGNLDNEAKLKTFGNFINEREGNLAKIFSKDKNANKVFKDNGLDLKELAKGDRKDANKAIIDKIANKDFAKTLADSLKPVNGKVNGILKRARSLSSTPSFLSTVLFVPVFLGVVLPKIVYGMTAKRHKKMEAEDMAYVTGQAKKAEQAQPAPANQNNAAQKTSAVDYSKLNSNFKGTALDSMKHSA